MVVELKPAHQTEELCLLACCFPLRRFALHRQQPPVLQLSKYIRASRPAEPHEPATDAGNSAVLPFRPCDKRVMPEHLEHFGQGGGFGEGVVARGRRRFLHVIEQRNLLGAAHALPPSVPEKDGFFSALDSREGGEISGTWPESLPPLGGPSCQVPKRLCIQ